MKSIKTVISATMSVMMLLLCAILVSYATNALYQEKRTDITIQAKQSLTSLNTLTSFWQKNKIVELEYIHAMVSDNSLSEEEVRNVLIKSLTDQSLINAYVGYSDGRFILNDKAAQLDALSHGYDPRQRSWYQMAINAGKPVLVSPYVSSDGSQQVVVSMVMPLVIDGKVQGVIGIDSSVTLLQDLLRSIPAPPDTQMMILDDEQRILAHTNDGFQLKESESISKDIAPLVRAAHTATSIRAMVNDVDSHIVSAPTLQSWSLVMLLNRDAMVEPLRTRVRSLIIFALVTIVLAIVAISFTTKKLVAPLTIVNHHLEQASKGAGDLTIQLEPKSNDEVGQICHSFNDFNGTLREMVLNLLTSMNQVTQTSTQVKEIATQASKNVEFQQIEIEKVSTAVHEMNAAAFEIAQNIANSAQEADSAQKYIMESSSEVTATSDQIKSVAQKTLETSDMVQELSKRTDQIDTVVEVINNIAEQTNLLALNAAIEAARAGENGRGFAVVADEVRNLAQKTQNSTEEIRTTIKGLQDESRNLVEMMKQNSMLTHETVDQADKANAKLELVVASIRQISDMSAQIASASEEQHIVSEDIGKNIESIHVLSREVTSQAQGTNEASLDLKEVVGIAEQQLAQFKV
ncbi:methyl-accepting chemotaxis protein [Vibrio aquaticus]|uniref:Methyl-accepting chemotaxis protein n=1 Tax=Vibrio aquaticus TaxID=2496559 RepID=A0A432CXA5_9VIBR|nr:methyl-accepting chemotaxis protein [Vibrio aquaticus]RTZ16545.1 methyl-accepting chemotaxis protein [Vibrio aquaticus]